jgi:hypothetical protein
LLIVAALYLSRLTLSKARRWVIPALAFAFIISQVGALEINQGLITHATQKPRKEAEKVGKYDVTLDMFGWRAFKAEFIAFLESQEDSSLHALPIVSQDLYQSAHLDYYLARPMQ